MAATKAPAVMNGHRHGPILSTYPRTHPQNSYDQTEIDPDSFFGKIRSIYGCKVLQTQLEQLKKQGSYDAFDLQWQDIYNVRRLHGAKTRKDGIPPSLFWASDIGKWIEAVSYFLSCGSEITPTLRYTFETAVDDLIDRIEKAQAPDGYLDIYFTVVDPEGRFKNLRDMHEMYNCGHLLEGALAHYHWTGSRRFLNCMVRYVDLFMDTFGPDREQLHGYPGHPELELAVSRLYQVTKDPRHLAFATYLLEARGTGGSDSYFVQEAKQRGDPVVPATMDKLSDIWYHQAHEPLHDQQSILGHSVRAFYLITAAADIGGPFLEDAKRLLIDATTRKMYVTGGFGTEPRWEGFSAIPYRLPQSTDEGGCYQETCASIACMMTCERVLSHKPDGATRDIMELCLMNAVLGGGSLDGTRFSYENKLATYGDEDALRNEWFEVCCCPPNLSRTVGILGGYTWAVSIDSASKVIHLNVWLYVSAKRTIPLGDEKATVKMTTLMPWRGSTTLELNAPEGWTWDVLLPLPNYASDCQTSVSGEASDGFIRFSLSCTSSLTQKFDLPVRLLSSHPRTGQDTLTVSRGPIIYTAESIDNVRFDDRFPHFRGLGVSEEERFEEVSLSIDGIDMIALRTNGSGYVLRDEDRAELYSVARKREWQQEQPLQLVPWFARGNRGGKGRLRTSFLRVSKGEIS